MEQSAVNRSAVFEADFDLRRMDVDIYGFWIDLHLQKTDRQTTDHQQSAIGF